MPIVELIENNPVGLHDDLMVSVGLHDEEELPTGDPVANNPIGLHDVLSDAACTQADTFDEEELPIGELAEINPFDLHDDPLSVPNAEIKDEDLEVFHLDAVDRDMLNHLMDDMSDDDIICDALVMPLPMSTLRNGMVKQENDPISGRLPFKPLVNRHFETNLIFVLFHICNIYLPHV